jgi:protein-S-isoprenylcysteine O-methyltransferase Ste14
MRRLPALTEPQTNVLLSVAYFCLAGYALRGAIQFHQRLAFIYFAIHVTVAVLFLIRHRSTARATAPLGSAAAVLAMFYIYLFSYATPTGGVLGHLGAALIWAGAVACLLSVVSLGRCFGIFPSYRGLETRLMYRIVRHPIYASYIVMDTAMFLSFVSLPNAALVLAGIALMVIRIHYEEEILRTDDRYVAYARQVRYRLLPFVY